MTAVDFVFLTRTAMRFRHSICGLLFSFLTVSLVFPAQLLAQLTSANHVVLIGMDGLSPEGILQANTPQMDNMMDQGAWTMQARAIRPTSSGPNWASMLMGAGPEQHGVTSDSWSPTEFTISPVVEGVESIFPTIFSLLHEQIPEASAASIFEWNGISRYFEHTAVDVVVDATDAQNTADVSVSTFDQEKPTLTFIHFDHVDHAGHAFGWESVEFIDAVEEADRYIGEIIAGLEAAGMMESTVLIVASDHGGIGTRHGGDLMVELEIPWMMQGPGVQKSFEITQPVYIYDTAATIAAILGLARPYAWIGRPILTAFEDGVLTSNEERIEMPGQPALFAISQNYPNPFGPETQFDVEVVTTQQVEAILYDIEGRQIASLFRGLIPANYKQQIQLEVPDLANGLYMVRFQGEQFNATRKVVLLR